MKKILCAMLGILYSFTATSSYAATTCKNLFDPTTAVLGDINTNGVIGELSYRIVSDFIPVVPGQKYVGSGQMYMVNSGLRDFGPFITGYYNANKEFISGSRIVHSDRFFTIPDGVSYARVEYGAPSNDGTAIIAQSKLQFEQGDTPTTYCSACDGEIKNSLNLFNSTQYDQYKQADGTYRAQGNVLVNIPINATSDMIGKTYTFSVFFDLTKEDAPTSMSVDSYIDGVAKEGAKIYEGQTGYSKVTFTPTSTNDYFGITYGSNGGRYVTFSEIQLEQGSERTTYHPYGSYCQQNIRVATTKYVETQFSDLGTRLAAAVATVNTVVSNTIAQATGTQAPSIVTLQSGKQTRPNDIADDNEKCPAYKQCLLVEDENGTPHWYQITDPFRDFVRPIIANNVAPASTTNQPGYTQLEYIASTGTQYIDTGIVFDSGSLKFETDVYVTANLTSEEDFIGNFTGNTTTVGFVGGFARVTFLYSYDPNVNVPRVKQNSWQKYIGEFTSDNEMILTYDGTTVSATRTKQHNSSPIVLFRGSASYTPATHIRLGIVSIYINNTLVRNMIPVRRNSDNAIGMYDTVTKTFFTNAGSGTFTDGPAVANTDVPANPTWSATWAANATTGVSAGTVSGEAKCNRLQGQSGWSVATDADKASSDWAAATGLWCWCKATGFESGGEATPTTNDGWVFRGGFGSVSDCVSGCAGDCMGTMVDVPQFRRNILNAAQ
ncbi:MAG: hypothetical protein ACLRFM_01435 [Alphaproteobacteria bacterium]